MTQLNFGRDNQGMNAYAPSLSAQMQSATIASGDDESITVPSNAKSFIAVFSYQSAGVVWVAVNDTAAPPGGATFTATTSFLEPAQITVNAGDVISCYNNAATDQDVGVAFYANP